MTSRTSRSTIKKRPEITIVCAEPMSGGGFKGIGEVKSPEIKYNDEKKMKPAEVPQIIVPPPKPQRPPVAVPVRQENVPIPSARRNIQSCVMAQNYDANSSFDGDKEDRDVAPDTNGIPVSSPVVCSDSIDFNELKMKFGGNWLDNNHNIILNRSSDSTPPAVARRNKTNNNNITIIRPKTVFSNKPCNERKNSGTKSPTNSFDEGFNFFSNLPNENNPQVTSLLNKPPLPLKPTIIKPKPSLTKSLIVVDKIKNNFDNDAPSLTKSINAVDNIKNNFDNNVPSLTKSVNAVDGIKNNFDNNAASLTKCINVGDKIKNNLNNNANILSKKLPPRPSPPSKPVHIDDGPRAVALFDYDSGHSEDLKFKANDEIMLESWVDDAWMKGHLKDRGKQDGNQISGIFPSNFVQIIVPLPSANNKNSSSDIKNNSVKKENITNIINDIKNNNIISNINKNIVNANKMSDFQNNILNKYKNNTTVDDTDKNILYDKKVCRALPELKNKNSSSSLSRFDFCGVEENGELNFKAGQLIIVTNKVNDEWMEGEMNKNELVIKGIFPISFVDLNISNQQKPTDNKTEVFDSSNVNRRKSSLTSPTGSPKKVIAIYDFLSNHEGDLNFKAGQVIQVLREVDDDWLEGRINKQIGIFPKNFVF